MDPARFAEAFREEAAELFESLESNLVALEREPTATERIHSIFRALHTLKGSGAMFGFDRLSRFAHRFEDLFDALRQGRLTADSALIDLTLRAVDRLRRLLHTGNGPSEAGEDREEAELLAQLNLRLKPVAVADEVTRPAQAPAPSALDTLRTWHIEFKTVLDFFRSGARMGPVLDQLRTLGTLQATAQVEEVSLADLDPESCRVHWSLDLNTSAGEDAVRDAFVFVEHLAEIRIAALPRPGESTRLGEILVERGDLKYDGLQAVLSAQKPFGQVAVDKGLVAPEAVAEALEEQAKREARKNADPGGALLRVRAERVNSVIDRMGELVTLQSRLRDTARRRNDADLRGLAEAFERLTYDLRDLAMGMRMVPVGELFHSYQRPVRDLGRELGKQLELVTQGDETELDKQVIDALKDPLLHILRNSLDHGLETPEVRRARGKSETGKIVMSAAQEGSHVLIRISDDGAGIDAERVRAKAIERGLIAADAVLTTAQIHELIFEPGFSTAEKATSVSGRGVGMDVVRRSVDKLRGKVELHSENGRGTSIHLRLPLTLAMVEGLLTRTGDQDFLLNLQNVEECVDLTPEVLGTITGSNAVTVRGERIPFVRLREELALAGEPPAIERMVVVRHRGSRIGLVVDHALGQHQTVIKPLGGMFKEVVEVTGTTILGDGTVALILDATALLQKVELQESQEAHARGSPAPP